MSVPGRCAGLPHPHTVPRTWSECPRVHMLELVLRPTAGASEGGASGRRVGQDCVTGAPRCRLPWSGYGGIFHIVAQQKALSADGRTWVLVFQASRTGR